MLGLPAEVDVSWFTNCLISGILIPYLLRLGRCTNSPPQFGQVFFISSAHFSQKVHSYEQIIAIPFAASG